MTEAEQSLIDIAILMAQELQEYVDVAIECAGSNSAELATQELLKDWERAYKACGFSEEGHWMSPMLCTTSEWVWPNEGRDMPAPGQRVLMYYQGDNGPTGPTLATPIHADGSHLIDGESIYAPIICWHALPDGPLNI